MSIDSPFSGPFAGAPGIGGDPLDTEVSVGIKCPKCKSTNFRAWTTDYGVMRKCLIATCLEEWSGGTMASGRSNFQDLYPQPLPGAIVPDDDLPIIQYTGGAYRDPSKNFGHDDDDYY